TLAFPRAVFGDDRGIKLVEGFSVVPSLLQDRLPTQTRLRSFEDQELEQQTVVVDRHAPFGVMVLDVELGLRPRTTKHLSLRRASLGRGAAGSVVTARCRNQPRWRVSIIPL